MHVVPRPDAGPGEPTREVPSVTGEAVAASRLRALLDIAKVVGATRRFADMVELTAEQARRALDAASLSISRWERETGLLRTLVNVGVLGPGEVRFPDEETYALSQWPDIETLVDHGSSFIASVDDGSLEAEVLAALAKDSSVSVPIMVEGRVWGELWASRLAGQPRFAPSDQEYAEAVATQVAAGVVQADHFARIEQMAFTDALTGLGNRRAVDDRLEADLDDHQSRGTTVSLVLADINRLKQVNDTFGHDAGDRLITSVAEAASRASGLAAGSLAARIGGDEFCVVVTGVGHEVAVAVAEELCRLVDGQPMSTGVSCGVASTDLLADDLVDSPLRLFRLADAAQYRAKRSGARRPVVAGRSVPDEPGDSPSDRRSRRGRLSTDVPAALESGLAALDALAGSDVRARLECAAEHIVTLLDAAGWWLSVAAHDDWRLVTLSGSVQRSTTDPDAGTARAGDVFDLRVFPVTRHAIENAGSFFVEAGMPGNDPAEEAALVTAGYQSALGAGATGSGGGWLVEVYGDPISLPMGAFEPVLRALVAVAVAGAVPVPPG